jgi:hypothetical protein
VEVVEKLGAPDSMKKKRKRGRKRVYSMRKLIAAVIAKGTLSFVDLALRKAVTMRAFLLHSQRAPCSTFSLHFLMKII